MTEEEKQEAAALEEGLARAFQRLDMIFESPEAYLDFWFPDRSLTYGRPAARPRRLLPLRPR